jgi:hypothetical protein
MVTTALGYTPYNSSNPDGFISSASLSSLTDASINNPTDGQVVMYNSTISKWQNIAIPATSWGQITGTITDQIDLKNALDSKEGIITGAASSITSNNLTASKALVSNSNGKVAVSNVSSIELGYLSGVTSAIQTQIDSKTTMGAVEAKGYITGITSTDVINALGYTPYNGTTNPNSFITGIAWGEITGTITDQTDLKNALDSKVTKFSTVNPALTSASNIVTWTISNSIGSKKVDVCIYEINSAIRVLADVYPSDSTIIVKMIGNDDIEAGTYEAVVIG